MSDEVVETGNEHKGMLSNEDDRRLEICGVILLGIVSLITAWAGFQATKWSGEQASNYSQASSLRIQSNREAAFGYVMALNTQANVNNWIDATELGEEQLAATYARRLEQSIPEAWNAWLALDPLNNPDAPTSPVAMPEFTLAGADETASLENQASETFEDGQEANEIADNYVLATAFLAMALFFTGLSTTLNFRGPRIALLAASAVVVGGALIYMATLDVTF